MHFLILIKGLIQSIFLFLSIQFYSILFHVLLLPQQIWDQSQSSRMASEGCFHITFPILDGKNKDKSRIQMRVMLGYQEVLEVVVNGVLDLDANPTEMHKQIHLENKKKDCKALFFLHQSIDSGIFEKIFGASIVKEAWDILDKRCKRVEKIKKVRF